MLLKSCCDSWKTLTIIRSRCVLLTSCLKIIQKSLIYNFQFFNFVHQNFNISFFLMLFSNFFSDLFIFLIIYFFRLFYFSDFFRLFFFSDFSRYFFLRFFSIFFQIFPHFWKMRLHCRTFKHCDLNHLENCPFLSLTITHTFFFFWQEALETCTNHVRELVDERIYILARMDNTREALRLVTSENYDIHKAVEFCKVILNSIQAQCLKISEKVAFNIASEASYVYILNGQKLIKNAKNGQFWRILKIWNLRSNSVTRKVNFNRKKIGEKMATLKMRHFQWFLNKLFRKVECDFLRNF